MPSSKKKPTYDEIQAARTPNGGWTRKQLAEWGVPWPPPKGWQRRLVKPREASNAGPRVYVEQPIAPGTLVYWTDGSTEPNPGYGGCAVVLDGEVVFSGTEPYPTTNIRMEGMAILAALKHSAGRPAVIMTDSQFWEDVLTKWAAGWEKKGWRKRDKSEPGNLDLVKPMWRLYSTHPSVEIRWVRGHAGHEWNEMADDAATMARLRTDTHRERPF